MDQAVVIIGAGHAAGQLAARLRAEGHGGPVTLVGEEAHPPYQRPPLSKAFLAGEEARERTFLRPPGFYAENGIELRLGVRAEAIDRDARRVRLADGTALAYDVLVLATGARPRPLPVPGADLEGVRLLRTLDDAEAIRARLGPDLRLAVVGGGYIGLEVAATAVKRGARVTVLEAAPRLMPRVVGETTAAFFERRHREAGVEVRLGATVSGLAGEGAVSAVELEDGGRLEADLVVVGVGVVPNQELAAAAGLAVDDGIVVDERGRTADPRILAAGDCTRHPSARYGRAVRLESVHNAMSQARVVAANVAGKELRYDEPPWFWSDQLGHKLQIVGLAEGHDRTVVRGDPDAGPFTVFYLRDGEVVAADTVDDMKTHLACRKLVGARARPDPDRLADPAVPVAELAG